MSYGNIDGEFNPAKIKVLGDKVAIEKGERYHDRVLNGIIVPEMADCGARLNQGKIRAISGSASKKSGLVVGDIVVYDTFSVFYDTHPTVITNLENIIYSLVEDKPTCLRRHIMYSRLSVTEMENLCKNDTSIIFPDRSNVQTYFGETLQISPECVNLSLFIKYKYIVIDNEKSSMIMLHDKNLHFVHEDGVYGFVATR